MDTSYQEPQRRFVVNPGRPIVRNTFRFVSRVGKVNRAPTDFEAVIKEILQWVQAKHHEALPEEAYLCGDFEVDSHSTTIAATRIGDSWALRLRQPDAPFGDREAVAGRQWTTELAVRKDEDGILFGCRVVCSSQPYSNPPVNFTRPRILVDLANKFGLTDDLQLVGDPTYLQSREDLELLREFLESSQRRKPVVVVSEFEEDQSAFEIPSLEEVATDVARRLHCLAHVFALPRELAEAWTETVGKEWSVFRGGIRNYQAGLDFESQAPYEHHLMIGWRVLYWRWDGQEGTGAFARFLAERCIETALARNAAEPVLTFYSELRLQELAEQSAEVPDGSESDLVVSLREQIGILNAKVEEWQGVAEQAMDDEALARSESEALQEDNRLLRLKVDALQQSLQADGRPDAGLPERPSCYEDVAEWCKVAFPGRLRILPRGERGLKGALFEDLNLVLDCLQLLANEYREYKRSVPDGKAAFEARCQRLGVGYERSISATRAGEQGDQYEVKYPLGTNGKRQLEWHLTKGSAKNDKLCMRIYFFFDEDTNEVVVGWLPSHLNTRSS